MPKKIALILLTITILLLLWMILDGDKPSWQIIASMVMSVFVFFMMYRNAKA